MSEMTQETVAKGVAAAEEEAKYFDKYGHGSNDKLGADGNLRLPTESLEKGLDSPKVDPIDIATGDYNPNAGYN